MIKYCIFWRVLFQTYYLTYHMKVQL